MFIFAKATLYSNMNFKRSAFLLLFVATFITQAYAQLPKDTVSLNTIIAKTSKVINALPFEKVYLHLDKPYYASGDTVWLKAYVTIDQHIPTTLSSNVYVDISTKDSLVRFLKLPIVNGVASGNIILSPTDFKQGNFHIRAYTAWMRNFDPDYFFNKNVVIGNAIDNSVNTNVSFTATPAANATKISAGIIYKDPGNAAVLANKKVSWAVTVNGDEVSKGKGTTDANGLLNLDFTGSPTSLKTGTLTTVIDMGNRKSVTSNFSLKTAAATRDVQFFPEGGELIEGVRSKVAFKVVGTNGLGVDVKGTVTDNTGTAVAEFTSKHLGMGIFAMMPEAGKTYKVNITFPDGAVSNYNLPRIKAAGVTMGTFPADADNITLKIATNAQYLEANKGKIFYIIAQNGGVICFAAKTTLESLMYSAPIPKSKFPTGIVQFTLLTAAGLPVSERIAFVQRNDALNLTMSSLAKTYNIRQKVKLNISAKNKALPVAGNFSIAVIDETKVPFDENSENSILSNLLLTSDLKGYVEKPNYYFINKDQTVAAEDLDILMLTQGYRRLSYRNILADKNPQLYFMPEQNGIEITGVLRNNTGMTIAKGNLRLQIPAKNYYAETVTDMVGNYKFSKLNFPDSSQVIINARNNVNSKNLTVTVNGESYQGPSKNIYAYDEVANIDSAFKPYLLNSKKQYDNLHILKEVVVKSTVIKAAPHTTYSSLSGLSPVADQVVSQEAIKSCPALYNCISSLVLGTIVEDGKLYFLRNYNSNKKNIQVYVNGSAVDLSYLMGIDGKGVETIEVFKSEGFSGIDKMYGTSGVVSITLKKVEKSNITFAQLKELVPPPSIATIMPLGYGIVREFYSPKYDVLKAGNLGGDLRSTIYWNPKIVTDKLTGAASVEYFNADGRGTYRATIEGFDADGNLGRYVYRYTVK
jgi:hypothetical protein